VNVRNERIAIVGIGMRYPDAASPQELWENICAGRRAFRRRPGEVHDTAGHTRRLALDTAAAALADAGLPATADGFVVDGVHSPSPLSVVHSAEALAGGDLDVAIAGGVDQFDVLGCGMVVLMREADALACRCRIYASITGWGVSIDGTGGGTLVGHRRALTRAYERAGYGVETVSYFEGRGATTEIYGLSCVRRETDPTTRSAALGTIAGTLGAARTTGVAGLIKAALAVHHQVIPPANGDHPMLTEPNAAVHAPVDAALWPADLPVRAGVSATGGDGTHLHITLEEAPGRERRTAVGTWTTALVAGRQDAELLLVDADSSADLRSRLTHLAEVVATLSYAELIDVAGTLAIQRRDGAFRAAVVTGDPADAADKLTRLAGELAAGRDTLLSPADGVFLANRTTAPRIAYLFPGQGAGRARGGALRRRFAVAGHLFAMAAAQAGHSPDEPVTTEVAPPLVAAGSVAGLRTLHTLGVDADIAVGQGVGEVTALSWAGAMDGGDLLRVATLRGQVTAQAYRHLVLAGDHGVASPQASTEQLAGLRLHEPRRPALSTVTGLATDLPALLAGPIAEPARFHATAAEAVAGVDLAIEVGPGRALAGLAAEAAPDTLVLAMDTDSTSLSPLLTVAGAAFALGADLDPTALFADRVIRPVAAVTDPRRGPARPRRARADATLDMLRRLTAARVAMPLAAVTAQTDPLDDLLLSPAAIRQIVDDATSALGRPALAATTNLATVTLGELAGMVDRQAAGHAGGHAPWARPAPVLSGRTDMAVHNETTGEEPWT
jgi:enediyne polyketide synthase